MVNPSHLQNVFGDLPLTLGDHPGRRVFQFVVAKRNRFAPCLEFPLIIFVPWLVNFPTPESTDIIREIQAFAEDFPRRHANLAIIMFEKIG